MFPYIIVFEKVCHLPVKLEHQAQWAIKQLNFDLTRVGELCKLQISELEEIRNETYDNAWITKSGTKFFHDQIINRKYFAPGQKVLLYNSRLHVFAGKLISRWLGLFTICTVSPHSAVIIIDPKSGEEMKVKGQKLKPFLTTEPESQDENVLGHENVLGLVDPSYTWQHPTTNQKKCK